MIQSSIKPSHLALFLFVALIWGGNFAVTKLGLTELPPLLFISLRFIIVAVLLLPFVKPPTGHWRGVALVSVTLGFLHFALMFTGLTKIDAATAAIAIQLQVPFAALLAAIFFNDKLGWRRALGMAIAFLGVAVIAGEPRLEGSYLALGMVIAAACIWAIANVQIKLMGGIQGSTLNAYIALFAVPQLLLASVILESGQWQAVTQISWLGVFAVLYNGIAVVVIGYGFWYWLLKQHDVNQAMPITLLVPPIGVAAGVIFLGEDPGWAFFFGGLLTVIGVGIIIIRRPRVADPQVERL